MTFTYYRKNGEWVTPDIEITDRERKLLDEIELLRIELETINAKLATLLTRTDL